MAANTPTPLKDLALGVAMPETMPSPLPWVISDQGYIVPECIPVRGRAVAIRALDERHGMQDEADANAALIVTAVNSHADLFDLAKNVAGFDDSLLQSADLNVIRAALQEFRDQARAAIMPASQVRRAA